MGVLITKDKKEARKTLSEYLVKQAWCLKYDPNFLSARKEKKMHSKARPEGYEPNDDFAVDLFSLRLTMCGFVALDVPDD